MAIIKRAKITEIIIFLFILLNKNFFSKKMSYIQLPYRLVRNEKQLQFNLPKHYEEYQYIKRLPYIRDKELQFENSIINVIRNHNDLKNGF